MAENTDMVDARAPRFAAAVTAVVLGAALLSMDSWAFAALVGIQGVAFLLGATLGITAQPYVWVFDHLLSVRLSPTTRWQSPTAPRVSQGIALALLGVALIAWLVGAVSIAAMAVAAAWIVALTLALTGYCIGCQGYAVWREITAPVS
ncbi:MAG: DUF4395 domain-containing protein [Candidatus Nanopelagicales bacterium]